MRISYTKSFVKLSKKLNLKVRVQLIQGVTLFSINPLDSQLRDHQLKGKYKEYRSIDITGDYRAFYLLRRDEVILDVVGTHTQLYG